jgi:hypothetical protein
MSDGAAQVNELIFCIYCTTCVCVCVQYREEARHPRLALQLTVESYSSSSDSSSNGHRDANGSSNTSNSAAATAAAAATSELSVIEKSAIASAQRQGIPTYACQLIWVRVHTCNFGSVKLVCAC